MSEYEIRALDASTWDAYARLLDKHKGCGFGGCWCTWFHSREGRPEGLKGRPWKERLVREGNAHAALVFDGDAAVAWCQYGSPDELPNIHHRKEYEATRTDELPDYRITCIFVDRDYRRKGVAAMALRGAVDLIAQGAAAWWRAIRTICRRARRCGPSSSTTPRAASTSRPASATTDQRARRTA